MNYLIEPYHYEEVMDPALVPKMRIDPAGNIINTEVSNTVAQYPVNYPTGIGEEY